MRTSFIVPRWLVLSLGVAVGAAACATSPSEESGGDAFTDAGGLSGSAGAPDGGTSGGAGGSAATGGRSGSGGTGGAIIVPDSGAGGGGHLQDGGECTGTVSRGESLPLALFVLFDRSVSMLSRTSSGTTKWDAATAAFSDFANSPTARDLGLGLQYFPLWKPGVPDSCTNDAQCGGGGPCYNRACSNWAPCSNGSCGLFDTCGVIGECENDRAYTCRPVGSATACSGSGGPGGRCVAIARPTCINATSCDDAVYDSAAVPLAFNNGAAITASLTATTPQGNTPTGPALRGGLAQARAYLQANPTHKAALVLATDGMPTECSPTQISSLAGLAAAAAGGSPSIQTFVIGVFSPSERATATANLDEVAAGGGTERAFIIDTNQNVTQAFAAALEAIRGTALSCDFAIPPAPPGESLDFAKVNMSYTAGGQSQDIVYVGEEANCTAATGGWYYDVKPELGQPTKLVVCPSTCTAFKTGGSGSVDIKLGCATIVQ